jgi:hypothetical protein
MRNEKYLISKSGYKFYFQEGDNQIACFGSFFSGKEDVYINDDLVSTKRNFGFKSVHKFEFEGTKYSVIYELKNAISGKLDCSLLKGNMQIATQSQSLFSENPKKAAITVLWCFIVGFAFGGLGYAFSYFLFGWK